MVAGVLVNEGVHRGLGDVCEVAGGVERGATEGGHVWLGKGVV